LTTLSLKNQTFPAPFRHWSFGRREHARMFVTLRGAALLASRVIVVITLTTMARPAVADSQLVIAVPEVQALTPEVVDIAARATADFRRQLTRVESLRVIEGPAMPPGYQDRVPPFALWREAHVDLLLAGYAKAVSNRPVLQVRVWDMATGGQIVGQVYVSGLNQQSVFGEEVADEIRDALMTALDQRGAPVQR
jgi:TolB protein